MSYDGLGARSATERSGVQTPTEENKKFFKLLNLASAFQVSVIK